MSSVLFNASGGVVSVFFVPCSRLGDWGGTPAGNAGGVGVAGGVGDAGGDGVSIRTLMQSYMGCPSSKSTGSCWVSCWAALRLVVRAPMDLGWLMMRMVPFLSSRLKKCSLLMSKSARL